MLKLRLQDLLLGVAFLAIAFAFVRSEGTGKPESMVESVSFSADGVEIGVAVLGARSFDHAIRLRDLSRTLCVVKASTGDLKQVLEEDNCSGYHGPSTEMWHLGRTSALMLPQGGGMLAVEFGGGAVLTHQLKKESARTAPLYGFGGYNIALSESTELLAIGRHSIVTIVEVSTGRRISRLDPTVSQGFLLSPLLAFTDNDQKIAVAGGDSVQIWDIKTGVLLSTIRLEASSAITGISNAKDMTLAIGTAEAVFSYRYAESRLPAILVSQSCNALCTSITGETMAIGSGKTLVLHSLRSGDSIPVEFDSELTSVCFSPDGKLLGVGDSGGRLTMIEVDSRKKLWSIHLPVRHGTPWTVPLLAFLVLTFIVVRLRLLREPRRRVEHSN